MCWVAYLKPITPHSTLPVWIPIRMSTLNPVASRTNLMEDIFRESCSVSVRNFDCRWSAQKTFNLWTDMICMFSWEYSREMRFNFDVFTSFPLMMFICIHVKCMDDRFKFPWCTLSFTIISLVAHATPMAGTVNYCKTLSSSFTFGMHWRRSGLPHSGETMHTNTYSRSLYKWFCRVLLELFVAQCIIALKVLWKAFKRFSICANILRRRVHCMHFCVPSFRINSTNFTRTQRHFGLRATPYLDVHSI